MGAINSMFTAFMVLLVIQIVDGNLVKINNGVSVSIGRSVKIDKTMLSFSRVNMMDTCKVELINNEPMTQRVGQFEPQVFDCDYFAGSLCYTHSGSPFLTTDYVKLRVFHLTATSTFQETFVMNITIRNDPYEIFQPKQRLSVSDFNGQSNVIDSNVLGFNYSESIGSVCMIHLRTMTKQLPAFGQLISQHSGNPERIRTLSVECDDFVLLGIQYEHLVPPTPNVDFIALTAEVNDPNTGLKEETYYLPVDIEAAFPNQPPTALHMSMYLLEVDQFILTTIAPSILSSKDDETPKGELVFEVVSEFNISEGCIVHLNDQSQPIMSFTQYDVQMLNIAYKPPNTSFHERRNYKTNFVVYDSYFASSKPINLMFSVRNSITNAPRVMINKGLSLLEGQSRIISSDHLQIVDNDNIDRVRIKVMGGLMHGKLYNGDNIAVMFTPADIANGLITYQHDNSDSESDNIELRVSDIHHSVHATFPINILPKDDTPPYLIRNVQFNVQEGAVLRITKDLLLASDVDSPNDFILYKIMVSPNAGEILKKYSPKSFGYPVTEFTQRDLQHGRIYYSHLGEEIFEDSFDFVLLDNQIPPNMSPRQFVTIKIEPVDDLPPYLVLGTSLGITVLETEIGVFTQQNLQYSDDESPDDELVYVITTSPHFTDTYSLTDAGRIISTSEMTMPTKDPDHQPIISFTQQEIDHLRIAYMPPFKEIGSQTRSVQFIYSVSDKHGNSVLGQLFNITILPVDNQPPQILSNDIMVREGDTTIITHLMLAVTDMDTKLEYVKLRVEEFPNHGTLKLNGVNLDNTKSFIMQDIKHQRLRYVHDGSETLRDSFTLTAIDGIHTTTQDLSIIITPVNDGVPQILPGLINELSLPERGEILLSTNVLSATDVDTHDLLLKYIIIRPPSSGVILKNGNAVSTFTQMDVRDDLIKYKHTSGEIGRNTLEDTVTFVVSDKVVPSVDTLPLLDVHFSITPVNNQPPAIVVGNPYFVDEGQRTTINSNSLSAIDRDTQPQDIIFIVTQNPSWGFLENIQPDIGSEKSNAGKAIISFTMHDISIGNINYVQADHQGVEPIADFFMVYATDGQHISANVSFPVTIVPQNDEVPTLSITNFTLYEGSFYKLSSSFFFAMDVDIPMEMLMFSIIKAPRHGIIIDREVTDLRTAVEEGSPIYDFNLNQLLNTLKLTYVHDDSESTSDEFILRVTDGKHVVKKTCYINIHPVNDQYPAIMKNTGIILDMHTTRTLSSVVLLAYDADTPDYYLYYIITSEPRRGHLELYDIDKDIWKVIQKNENFTQQDLNLNHVRYQHVGALGSKGFDRIRFFVTDGELSTEKESFRIEITNTKKQNLEIVNNGALVQEGDFVVISSNLLSADDRSNMMNEIVYTVIGPPSKGQIELLSQPGTPVLTFTQLDLTAGQIIYIHKQTHQVENDHFSFMVSNGQESRNDTFYIIVEDIDNELPKLVLLQHVTTPEQGTVIIGANYLRSVDDDTPSDHVIYTIAQPPLYGQLLIGDTPVRKIFTQADIDNLKISYRHIRGEPDIDEFYFVVSDGTNIGYKIDDTVLYQPQIFTINIIMFDNVAPHITTMQVPTNLERKNGFYGYVLNRGNLEVVDERSGPSNISYKIVLQPLYGHLENTKTRRRISTGFTQQDINELSVVFVLKENSKATNDSFTFEVQDQSGNKLSKQRFEFKWSSIQFAQPDVLVCETIGVLPIHVVRSGYILPSSFVQISVHELGANVGLDFITSPSKMLQFDPGVTLTTFSVEVIQDNIEENRERVRLILREPVNAILGQNNRITIIIKDANNGVCNGEADGAIVTSNQHVRPFSPSGIPDCIDDNCDRQPGCLNSCDGPAGCTEGCIEQPLPEGCLSGCLNPEDIPPNTDQGSLRFDGPHGQSLASKIQIPGYQVSRKGQLPSGGTGVIPQEYLPEGHQNHRCGGCTDNGCLEDTVECTGCNCGDAPKDPTFISGQSSGPIEIPLLYPSAERKTDPINTEQGTQPISQQQRRKKKKGKKKNREETAWKTVFTSLKPATNNEDDEPEQVSEEHKAFRSYAVPVNSSSNTQTVWTFHGLVGGVAQEDAAVNSGITDAKNQDGKSSSFLGLLQQLQQDRSDIPPSSQPFVKKACSQNNIGELYVDSSTTAVYECNGQTWEEWQISQDDDGTDNSPCEQGWSNYNGKCYYLSSDLKTWNDAQRTCREQYGGNLVTITSKYHQKWVQNFIGGQEIWIGINDKFVEDDWEWVSQEPKMFTRWKNNEPQSTQKKNCASLSTRMRWVTRSCSKLKSQFVCEK
ncbi:FRAS1-related extracellular matrix protein 1-like [Antedon mediterranea]|uniref:FRAS1-related extracellular matrix protein 1-like n=1 Tax=Antedon mediterranea TaxID=105859 RepID=UPI003AF95DC4